MGKLLIENLSDDVLLKLEIEAKEVDRKLSDVAAERLEFAMRNRGRPFPRPTAAQLLRLADSVRSGSDEAWFTPEFIRLAREDGRE